MANFFNQMLTFVTGEEALIQVLIALLVLVFGHLGVKLFSRSLRGFWINSDKGLSKKDVRERSEMLRYIGYTLDAGIIILVLLYLNTGLTTDIVGAFVDFLPRFISVALIGLLGFIVIDLLTKIGSESLKAVGVHRYFHEIGLSGGAVNLIAILVKGFLYLILLQIALDQLGIGDTFINELVTASSWAAAFLIAGLVLYGFKDLFRNFAAGVYLKNSRFVRPGEEVKLGDETGEIREIALFSTTLNTDSGYTLMSPNTKIMESDIRFKRTKNDIETLEDIKNHFVAQNPAYCGPASMEMALEFFGYRYSQDDIGDEAGTTEDGTDVEELMEAAEELTNGEVMTGFIDEQKITDLGDELKAWFNDGALVLPHFSKPELFPDVEEGNYVLSVGAEGDEILVVDPNRTAGGVYYVEKNRLLDAMDDIEDGGYIVLAPKGTTAYWRLKNGLLYSEKTYYDEISKTLETRLRKILRQGRLLTHVVPPSLESYMDNWRSEGAITRLWDPEGERDEASKDN